jgi:hypothetical protein
MSKIMKTVLALAAVASIQAVSAFADDISIGLPAYNGTGCPNGSVSAALSPAAKQLSILFDQYTVEAGNTTGKSIDRKNCAVAIPVHVPNGLSVALFQIDYRGFNALPSRGWSQLGVEYFFAGSVGPKLNKKFVGPLISDYTFRNSVAASAWVWSPCGADTNLRISTSLVAVTNQSFEQASSSLDSIDIDSGLIFSYQFRKCINGAPVGPFVN